MQAVSPTQRACGYIGTGKNYRVRRFPSAIGSFAAVSEMIFTMDDMERNAGTHGIAINITAITMTMYIALLNKQIGYGYGALSAPETFR